MRDSRKAGRGKAQHSTGQSLNRLCPVLLEDGKPCGQGIFARETGKVRCHGPDAACSNQPALPLLRDLPAWSRGVVGMEGMNALKKGMFMTFCGLLWGINGTFERAWCKWGN